MPPFRLARLRTHQRRPLSTARSFEQLKSATPDDGRLAVAHDNLTNTSAQQYNAMAAATQQALQAERAAEEAQSTASEAASRAYALSSMRSAPPRGESAPSAIHVRVSSPDKL